MIIYSDMNQFYDAVLEIGGLDGFNQEFSSWANLTAGIQAGCACTREKRISESLDGYRRMCQILNEEDKQCIKRKLNTDEVQLSDSGYTVCVF